MSNFNVTVNRIGEYSIFTVSSIEILDKPKEKKNIRYFFTMDNSGSMGKTTKMLTDTIINGLVDHFSLGNDFVNLLPSTLIEFKECATVLSSSIRSSKDLNSVRFSQQGQTNITRAVETTCDEILRQSALNNNCQNIFVFLSDGQHNQGPEPTSFSKHAKLLKEREVKLGVIIIGISGSDNKVGMRIKTELETLELVDLENIYYVSSHNEMSTVLPKLTRSLNNSLVTSQLVDISLTDGTLFGGEINIRKSFSGSLTFLAKTSSNVININGVPTIATETFVTLKNMEALFEYYIPQFARLRITHGLGKIEAGLKSLEELINIFDKIQRATEQTTTIDDLGKIKLKPGQRLELLKRSKGLGSQTAELRNILNSMKINVSNDSRSQASYLTGMNNKYASKAVMKAGTIDKTFDQVLLEFKCMSDQLAESLAQDKVQFMKNTNSSQSFVSLMNPFEQIEEWDFAVEVDDIYGLLIAYGMCGYPVKFVTNNACQMDPFQTVCTFIDPTMIDSSTIALYNQLGNKLETFDKKEITDVLILVDPMCPNSSIKAMRSSVYQYLASTTLCRDLYMYNGAMPFAFHAHSFVASLGNPVLSRWNIDLALRILYSIRKYGISTKYFDLFNRWWNEWLGITQSNEDDCNHPVQLPILLSMNKTDPSQKKVPFKNLVAEYLARYFKMILRSSVTEPNDGNTKSRATKDLQDYFEINESNSPAPLEDILSQEPPLDVTRETCQKWANVSTTSKLHSKYPNVRQFVDEKLLPLIRAFEVASIVSNIDNFVESIEEIGAIPDTMIDVCMLQLSKFNSLQTYMELLDDNPVHDRIYENIFCQSYYYHFSSDRNGLNDFEEAMCLEDIIVKLRLSVYFEKCKIKTEQWQKIIGNVTYTDACDADINKFTNMLGRHVHGMCSQQFWGLLEAAKNDPNKRQAFIAKSNGTVTVCFEKKNKWLGK